MNVPVKIYTEFNHTHGLPEYAAFGDAGMDVRANEHVVIRPQETTLVKTGIYTAIPYGYEIQVRPRSGLSRKTKMRIPNSPGTIDHAYRGELCIIVENISVDGDDIAVALGDRIAQIVLKEVPRIEWDPVGSKEELGTTERGDGGFGSTGKA